MKFGIARELYRDEDRPGEASRSTAAKPPANPIAQNIGELLTAKQSALIIKLAQRLRREADDVCNELFHARLNEISRRAASQLIDHLEAALNPNGNHSSQNARDRAA